jgi:hypothetical protein
MVKRSNRLRIVISFYVDRPRDSLVRLLDDLQDFHPSVIVVMNTDRIDDNLMGEKSFRLIQNSNIGMNIGAWNRGFMEDPNADLYLFLQDECYLRRRDFAEIIESKFRVEPGLGMLGETINKKWDHPWSVIQRSALNTIEVNHFVGDLPSKRVETYLNAMLTWGIDPGSSGAHLRSLVWAFPGNVMRELGGFPIGRNKGECIAAEIAVSRKILSLGYRFDQISEKPFSLFGHLEWRDDGLSKRY